MEQTGKFDFKEIQGREERLAPGHRMCAGCGGTIAVRNVLKALHPGDIITEEDIHLLSPGDGFKWAERDKVVGRRVRKEIPRNEIIYSSLIEE